ncbi:MAG: HD domain-containing protein [Pirellulales bacterium]|nr:HD domain-containing protein [Pirellulales bacterium]
MSDTANAAPSSENLVSMDCESLIVGRTLRFPIYDDDGLLLLAEGMAITPEFRDKLIERKLSAIRVHPDEVSNISCSAPQEQMSFIAGDEELAKRLDEIIDSGFLTVVNSEPALIEQMTRHGTANYNLQKHLERVERNRESSIFVDNLMRNALHGRNIDFAQVTRLTASYMADMTGDIDSSIASMVDTVHQDEISDHCVKMSLLGMALGVEMLLDAPNVRNLGLAGLVHDWGMVRVPPEIRNAERLLTAEERYHITKHPMHTLRMLEKLAGIPGVVPVVAYQVHECPNGRGYPQGRARDRIHIMARILGVADRYDALISPRPFRPPLTPYAAMECLLRQSAAGDVDPDVVRALLMVQSLFPIGSYVVLSDGSTARVLRRNGNFFSHPIVRIVKDSEGKDVPEHSALAIIDLKAAGLDVVQALPNPGSNAVNLSPRILLMSDAPDAEDAMLQNSLGECLAPATGDGLFSAAANASPLESITSLEHYSEAEKRRVLDALDILDNSAQITTRTYQSKRSENRIALRTVASICIPDSRSPIVNVKSGRLLRVMTRDISNRGISFVCPDALPQERILIGLPVNDRDTRWFFSDIVRAREIADTGFWEHAVIFRQGVAL